MLLTHDSVPVVDPAAADGFFNLLWLIIALPAFGAAVLLLLGNRRSTGYGHWLGTATVAGSFLLSLVAFFQLLGRDADDRQIASSLWTWFETPMVHVRFGLLYDQLSALFLLLITGVGLLIHIYSIGYMEHDPRRSRFFAYLNLFIAAMLVLVMSDNYLGSSWVGRASVSRRTC